MSRVTIGDITEDLLPFTEKGNKVIPVEIVPRKMVEMIIEQYDRIIDESERQIAYFNEDSDAAYAATVRKSCVGMLKACAESLLKQFEEDK